MAEHKKYFTNTTPEFSGQIILDKDIQRERTLNILEKILKKFKNIRESVDGGLYVGLPGISYMLYHISKLPEFESCKSENLSTALSYMKLPIDEISYTLSHGRPSRKTGFITGLVGVYAMAAVVHHKLGNEKESAEFITKFSDAAKLVTPLDWYEKGGDELFVGRAGYLCGLLWLRRELGIEVVPDSTAFNLLDVMIASGVKQAEQIKCNLPLIYHYNGTFYFGPAHGLSGILLIMLRFPKWLQANPKSENLIHSTIDQLLTHQTSTGNFPSSLGRVRSDEDELTHWCHGAPGVVHLFGRAYSIYKDEKYLNALLRCGEVTWRKGLLRKGPGLCHGLAGSGYVFLLLYRVTNDEKHLYRAISFMEFYYNPDFSDARRPDSPYSLFEGLGGFACFSADLCRPQSAEFPFFPFD